MEENIKEKVSQDELVAKNISSVISTENPDVLKEFIETSDIFNKPPEMGKEVGAIFKSFINTTPKDGFLGKMLSGIADPTTAVGGKINGLFDALEKGEPIRDSVIGLLDTSSAVGTLVNKLKDSINNAENKAIYMTSEETLKMFRNYNAGFNITMFAGSRQITDKLMDVGNPFVFDFNSPIKQKWIKIFNILGPVESGDHIKVRYDILVYISENRFTELWTLLKCKSYSELKEKMDNY